MPGVPGTCAAMIQSLDSPVRVTLLVELHAAMVKSQGA